LTSPVQHPNPTSECQPGRLRVPLARTSRGVNAHGRCICERSGPERKPPPNKPSPQARPSAQRTSRTPAVRASLLRDHNVKNHAVTDFTKSTGPASACRRNAPRPPPLRTLEFGRTARACQEPRSQGNPTKPDGQPAKPQRTANRQRKTVKAPPRGAPRLPRQRPRRRVRTASRPSHHPVSTPLQNGDGKMTAGAGGSSIERARIRGLTRDHLRRSRARGMLRRTDQDCTTTPGITGISRAHAT